MFFKIPKKEWKDFFDGLSRGLMNWETNVQVMNDDIGAQVMTEGIAFNGLTYEELHGKGRLELSVGDAKTGHQFHTIEAPTAVTVKLDEIEPGGMLFVEEASGTKTLIRFIQPFPMLVEYIRNELIAV